MKITPLFFYLFLSYVPAAWAVPYSFLTFEAPNVVATWAYGINNLGEVSGTVQGSSGNRGFVVKDGLFEVFDVPLAKHTEARRINDNGDIVGSFVDANGAHGFVRRGDSYSTMVSIPTDINNDGSFVVSESSSNSPPHSIFTRTLGTNEAGKVVGFFVDDVAFSGHGFFGVPGSLISLDVPGAELTQAWDINNYGQIVGVYEDEGRQHGFISDGFEFLTLDVPGAYFTQLSGINDKGQIVGNWLEITGKTHAFVATPAVNLLEPNTLLLFMFGFAGLGFKWTARQAVPEAQEQ